MAHLDNKALFFTTSPRTPVKMIPEIRLLCEQFGGQVWSGKNGVQEQFATALSKADFFEGNTSKKYSAFSARDRITRAPKALGFVDLSPAIALTEAGNAFVYGTRPQEVYLRQLLKFQLPSPYHIESNDIVGTFYVRPYLEIMRLVRELEYLTFDELKIFALQLTDYRQFDNIKAAILRFRDEKHAHKGEYKKFVMEQWTQAVLHIHKDRIQAGKIKTRESADETLDSFVKKQRGNLRDYADACFRYLRYTGLFVFSGYSLKVAQDKVAELDYILSNVDRNPVFIDFMQIENKSDKKRQFDIDTEAYKAHLFSATTPALYVDIKDNIVDTLMRVGGFTRRELIDKTIDELKDLRDAIVQQRKDAVIRAEVEEIKSYALYSEIIDTYNEIISDEYYDAPLMFEYNTWRAMTMLDGGDIKGNFNVDDAGKPLSTAQGNKPDIECDYDDFVLSVEVTLQSGQRQYETEGEPVARHYGQMKQRTEKEAYCLFIAPTINPAALTHFYMLNQINNRYYGGKTQIVPLDLDQFMRLVESSYNNANRPTPDDVQRFLNSAIEQVTMAADEREWSERIQNCIDNWLVA
ncbi:AlwI family type II restriction endonuclease [Eubacteriales bacterium OttesenSCG-928-M02]|nr:AlwI family type II restriction endonuclease [Eubacteriales bacterium OttesenSCG-928-M02]